MGFGRADELIVVGYSGGADSTCLLHLLRSMGQQVGAAHLHHGQREEADQELQLCEAFCQELNVPFLSGRADVPLIATQLGIGLEEAGRKARYDFFSRAKAALGADLIATGHTKDDQLETVLFHLARGTGLRGLRGIPAINNDLVRPLLHTTRAETRAYCHEHSLWFHDDPANVDPHFARNRIRLHVVPELLLINENLLTTVTEAAEIFREEDELLDAAAANALEQAEVTVNAPLDWITRDCEAHFEVSTIAHLPLALRRRALRLGVRYLGGDLDRRGSQFVASSLGTQPGSWTVEGGRVVIEWNDSRLVFRDPSPSATYKFPFTIPGAIESDEFGWVLAAELGPTHFTFDRTALEVAVDPHKLQGSLHFRSLEPGDCIQPLGFNGHRKIADLMSEIGLTGAARSRIPIICDMIGPIWVPGVCYSDRVKASASTSPVLRLSFGPWSPKVSETSERPTAYPTSGY